VRVDSAEIRWMLASLKSGDVAVDAGAYKGGYTYWMRRAVGERGAVFAFEPQPGAAAMLRRYAAAFGWGNVTVSESALSSSVGTCMLLTPDDEVSPAASLVGASLQPGARALSVAIDPLDAWLTRHAPSARVAMLKVDVEGHELDVFRGARRVLGEHRPRILVECEARHLRDATMGDVFGYLHDLGYRGSFFEQGALVDVERFDVDAHQVAGRRPYVNNFVFMPGE
jgi:FkbM family methyltransferase